MFLHRHMDDYCLKVVLLVWLFYKRLAVTKAIKSSFYFWSFEILSFEAKSFRWAMNLGSSLWQEKKFYGKKISLFRPFRPCLSRKSQIHRLHLLLLQIIQIPSSIRLKIFYFRPLVVSSFPSYCLLPAFPFWTKMIFIFFGKNLFRSSGSSPQRLE